MDDYHQYHIRFDTDFRKTAHLNGEGIAEFCRVVAAFSEIHSGMVQPATVDAQSIADGAVTRNSLKERMAALALLRDMEGTYILEFVRDLLLKALSDHDPQLYVDLSPGVKSMSVSNSDGTWDTYFKSGEGDG